MLTCASSVRLGHIKTGLLKAYKKPATKKVLIMKPFCVKDSRNKIIADNVVLATTFLKRARGLLFSDPLKEGAGLWIKPCNSVHTFFMTYSIDVVYLDKNLRIVSIIENMSPWRVSKIEKNAKSVLELRAGTVRKFGLVPGEQLVFELVFESVFET